MLQSIFVSLATRYMYMVFLCPSSFIDEMSWWRQRGRMSSVVDFLLLQHNIFISYRSATNNNVIEYMKGPFMYIWLTMKDMIVGQENKSQHEWKKRLRLKIKLIHYQFAFRDFKLFAVFILTIRIDDKITYSLYISTTYRLTRTNYLFYW